MMIMDKDRLTKQLSMDPLRKLQSQNSNMMTLSNTKEKSQQQSKNQRLSQSRHSLKQKSVSGQLNPQYSLEEYTSFLLPFLRIKRSHKVVLIAAILVCALFLERYSFIVSVYKTKYYGYSVILIVIFLNTIFSGLLAIVRKKKKDRRLHHMFNIERSPQVGCCSILIIG